MRTKPPYAPAATADAALLRMCSGDLLTMKRITQSGRTALSLRIKCRADMNPNPEVTYLSVRGSCVSDAPTGILHDSTSFRGSA